MAEDKPVHRTVSSMKSEIAKWVVIKLGPEKLHELAHHHSGTDNGVTFAILAELSQKIITQQAKNQHSSIMKTVAGVRPRRKKKNG